MKSVARDLVTSQDIPREVAAMLGAVSPDIEVASRTTVESATEKKKIPVQVSQIARNQHYRTCTMPSITKLLILTQLDILR